MSTVYHYALLLLLSFQLSAQDTEILNVTGSYIEQTDSPQIILTSEDLEAFSANSFADILRGLPGIDVSQQGGTSGLTFLSIRGGDPNFVTVLIDGVKVNDPTNSRGGAFDLGTLDPSIIEKVEIFYGSFSTLYGSDALSGVLKIQTKQSGDETTVASTVKAGTRGTKGASVHVSMPLANIAGFSLSGATQDGDDSTFGDRFERTELISSLASVADSKNQWRIGGFYAKGEGQYFPEDSGGERLAVIRHPESRDYSQLNIAAKIQFPVSEKFDLSFDGTSSIRKEQLISPGIAQGVLEAVPSIVSDTDFQRKDFAVTGDFQIFSNLNSVIGFVLSEEVGSMQSTIDLGMLVDADYKLRRDTKSVFTELTYKATKSSSIVAGVRRDETELLKVTTKRVVASTQLKPDIKISAQYSEGFKLPSFFALGHPIVGNTDLQPEKSRNIDISVDKDYKQNFLSTRLSLFQSTYTDLVDFNPILFTNVNRAKVRVKGAELSGSYIPNNYFNVSAQISYTNITTYDSDVNLRRRPKYKSSVNGSYSVSAALKLNLRYTVNSSYFDSSVPTGSIEIGGFNQLDASVHWHSKYNFDWRVQVNNLLDSNREETIGFERSGLNIVLGVTKQF